MAFSNDEINALAKKFEASQRKSRQRTLIAIAIPTIAATIYLGFTLTLVSKKQEELQNKNREIAKKTAEITTLDQELEKRKKELTGYKSLVAENNPRAPYNPQDPTQKEPIAATTSVPELVYIQIRKPSQREAAQKIADALQTQGYLTPRIEQVAIGPSKTSQVRYFRPEDRPKAEKLVQVLQTLQVKDNLTAAPIATNRTNIKHLEIWFSPNF